MPRFSHRPQHVPAGTTAASASSLAEARAQAWAVNHDAIVITNAAGFIVDWNPAAEALFGYTRDEALGQPNALIHLSAEAAANSQMNTAGLAQRGQWHGTLTIVRKDGTRGVCEVTVQPWRDATGRAIGTIACYHDISTWQTALAQVEAERQRLAALVDVLPAGIALYDAQGRLVQQNSAAARITGRAATTETEAAESRMERYAMRAADGTPLTPASAPSGRARAGATFTDFALVVTDPDGHPVDLLASGAPVPDAAGGQGAVVVFQDVTALRALEREADAQRRFADAIIASTPFGIAVFDASDEFRCLRHNTPFLQLVGADFQAHGTIIGVPLADFFDQTTGAQVCAVFAQVRTTGEPVFIHEFPAVLVPDPVPRWYRWSLTPLRDAAGTVTTLICCAVEITEIVRGREAERAESAQLAGVFTAMTEGVVVYDAQGRLLRANPVAQRIFGWAVAEPYLAQPLPARHAQFTLYDAAGQALDAMAWPVQRILAGDVIASTEGQDVRFQRANGQWVHLNISGAPLRDEHGAISGAVVLYRDVTERRALSRRTHQSLEALLRMAQAAVATGADTRAIARELAQVTCDVLGCRRVGVSSIEGAEQFIHPLAIVGLSPTEEKEWWAMQPANARLGDGTDAALVARLAAGEAVVLDMTVPPYNQAPNPFGVTTVLAAPMILAGRIVGILSLDHAGERHEFTRQELALARGVADLAALVIERERLIAGRASADATVLALREANRRMDEFLGIASHELRTPLTSMKMQTSIARRRLAELLGDARLAPVQGRVAPLVEMLDRSIAAIDRLNRLVEDLLDTASVQAGALRFKPTAGDLADVVREAVLELQSLVPPRRITLDLPAAPIPVTADLVRLGQVVTNFLTNALKYSEADRPVTVHVTHAAGRARVAVMDQGPGLPPEEQTRVWERFYRAPDINVVSGSGVGLGLGLHICKTIIEHHGGTVGITSAPGHGATFWFTLPTTATALSSAGGAVPRRDD